MYISRPTKGVETVLHVGSLFSFSSLKDTISECICSTFNYVHLRSYIQSDLGRHAAQILNLICLCLRDPLNVKIVTLSEF